MESSEPRSRRNRQRAPRERRPSYTIAFRLHAETLALLEQGAAAHEISIHGYARQLLIELLHREQDACLLQEAVRTRAAVEELREDFARMLEVLLVNLTPRDAASIRSWIDQNLRLRGE
jgi:hypothetical protein